jgi:hypothetical protein
VTEENPVDSGMSHHEDRSVFSVTQFIEERNNTVSQVREALSPGDTVLRGIVSPVRIFFREQSLHLLHGEALP